MYEVRLESPGERSDFRLTKCYRGALREVVLERHRDVVGTRGELYLADRFTFGATLAAIDRDPRARWFRAKRHDQARPSPILSDGLSVSRERAASHSVSGSERRTREDLTDELLTLDLNLLLKRQ